MEMENFIKIGKTIVVKGTQAVTVGAGVTVLTTLAKGGTDEIKKLTLDQLLK